MRRDTFLKSMAALAVSGGFPLSALAGANIKMMIPANPGGGWDTTGRALGKALQDAKVADTVTFDNKGGAAGALGLAQFVNGSKGDPNAMMVMGQVMLGGIITGKPPVNLSTATPLARLTSEYNVFVLPENSPLKTMKDVIDQMKKDPASVKWAGGSRGSTEHIAAAMIALANDGHSVMFLAGTVIAILVRFVTLAARIRLPLERQRSPRFEPVSAISQDTGGSGSRRRR